jgi:hypothetical protein
MLILDILPSDCGSLLVLFKYCTTIPGVNHGAEIFTLALKTSDTYHQIGCYLVIVQLKIRLCWRLTAVAVTGYFV